MMVGDPNRPPFGKLVKRPIPQWKNHGLQDYVKVETVDDTLYCKLPYNAQITPWLEVVSATGGDTIRIKRTTTIPATAVPPSVRSEYITRPGDQQYESLGWMSGHIVKYAIPKGVEVKAVKFRETGYDTEFAGTFACDDPFMNELWKRAARTLYVNMRDNYFDCPERERAQWWGDAVNELGQAFLRLRSPGPETGAQSHLRTDELAARRRRHLLAGSGGQLDTRTPAANARLGRLVRILYPILLQRGTAASSHRSTTGCTVTCTMCGNSTQTVSSLPVAATGTGPTGGSQPGFRGPDQLLVLPRTKS